MPFDRTLVFASLITAAVTNTAMPTDATAITKFECESDKGRCLATAPLIADPRGGQVDSTMVMTCIETYSQCLTLVSPEPSGPVRSRGPVK